jgi:hypothetical protein
MIRTLLATAAVGLALGIAAPRTAEAAFIATMQQVGSDVVVTGSGSFNLAAFVFAQEQTSKAAVQAEFAFLYIGPSVFLRHTVYAASARTVPANFGSGVNVEADAGTGSRVGVLFGSALVPQGYVSGTSLTSSSTWLNKDFSDLGVTPGSYLWTWTSNSVTETFTLNIIDPNPPVGVPAPPALALFGVGLVGLLATRRRRPA